MEIPLCDRRKRRGAFCPRLFDLYLFLGVPIFIAELIIGRSAGKAPVGAFYVLGKERGSWRFLGWSCVLATLLILSFYFLVAGWALDYTLMSLLHFTQGKTPKQIADAFDLLYRAGDINLLWDFLFLALTTAIVYRGIRKGIELWSKILMPALFVILLALLIYAFTLDGFPKAFSFIFAPNLSKMSPSGLLQALGLACFTLSVGMGIILTYGSYMRSHDDIPKTSLTVASMTTLVSLLAALMIFPITFTFQFNPQEGPGLLFKSLPVIFNELPGGLLIATIFFTLVVFAALTSTISIMEVLVATVTEFFGWSRSKGALIIGALTFIIGIPSALSGSGGMFREWNALYGKNFFDTVDFFTSTWLLPANAIVTAVFAGWVVDRSVMREGFLAGTRLGSLFLPWLFLIRWITPLGIMLIMLQQGGIINLDKILDVNFLWFKEQ